MVKGVALPDGVVVGEADKPLVEAYAKALFAAGASQDEMNRGLAVYYQLQDQAAAERTANDDRTRIASEVALRGEWTGADYTRNMNAVGAALAALPGDFVDAMLTARTADGTMLGNTIGFNKAMAQIGREINPAATIVPAGDGNAAKTVDAEIAAIEKSMYDDKGTPSRDYWGDEKKQARYRELIDTQQKMQGRGGARAA